MRQSVHWISRLLTVAPSAVEIGTATMNIATTFALSFCGYQYVRYRMIPGKNPASATPSRNRSTTSTVPFGTNAIALATTPQLIMIRAIHLRAPNRCSARLLGTSSSR